MRCSVSWRLSAVVVASIAPISACGAQNRGEDDQCEAIHSEMTAAEVEAEIGCYMTKPVELVAALCRDAGPWAASIGADALGAAVGCALSAAERSDGAWIAEILNVVAADGAKVDAVLAALAPSFSPDTHGNSFSAALTRAAQTAIGERLAGLDAALRADLVSIALGYDLRPLNDFAAPFIRELPADDPALAAYAESILDDGEAPGEDARWALAVSGEWSADDVVDCYRRRGEGCEQWDGESPLQLLDEVDEGEASSATATATLQIMRNDETDESDAAAIAAWMASSDYERRAELIVPLLNDLVDDDTPRAVRVAIAGAAREDMCDGEMLRRYLISAHRHSPEAVSDPSAPWSVFIAHCEATHWDTEDRASALAAGSWLTVGQDLVDVVRSSVASALAGGACDVDLELADAAYRALEGSTPMNGVIFSEIGSMRVSECGDVFASRILEVAESRDEHPEARLAAVLWLAERGDRSQCSRISSILDWEDPDYGEPVGARAEALAAEARSACE